MNNFSSLKYTMVPFQTCFVECGKVIWQSPDSPLSEEDCLSEYSWVVSEELEQNQEVKKFWADLYGGRNVAGNGGSGRSGYDGKYQVKGIGQTPLVGRNLDEQHSDGCLSTFQAICETLWGSVLNHILPYGAVISHAIIETPLALPNDPDNYRALLVRVPPVRLAHFDRALYYKPSEGVRAQLPRDSQRVEANIDQIEQFLDNDLAQKMLECTSPEEAGYYLLITLIPRMAQQLACCSASMVMLTTSPSNVTIGGALLDFNVTSHAVPMIFRNREHYDSQLQRLSHEWLDILESLQNLGFLWHKYRGGSYPPLSGVGIAQLYQAEYHRWRVFYTLSRLGFPPEVHSHLSTDELGYFISVYDRALVLTPDLIFSQKGKLPPVAGILMALSHSQTSAYSKLHQYEKTGIGHTFISIYIKLVSCVLAATAPSLLTTMIILSSRQLSIPEQLDFSNFNDELASCSILTQDYIDHAIKRALFTLSLDGEEYAELLPSQPFDLRYTWKSDQWYLGGKTTSPSDLPTDITSILTNEYPPEVVSHLISKDYS